MAIYEPWVGMKIIFLYLYDRNVILSLSQQGQGQGVGLEAWLHARNTIMAGFVSFTTVMKAISYIVIIIPVL